MTEGKQWQQLVTSSAALVWLSAHVAMSEDFPQRTALLRFVQSPRHGTTLVLGSGGTLSVAAASLSAWQ